MTEHRDYDDERYVPPAPPPRLGGTDVFRGAMVILAAVLIGAFVISRGLDDTANEAATGTDASTAGEDPDPASAAADDADAEGDASATDDQAGAGTGTDADADGAATGDTTTGTGTDEATDPTGGSTTTVPGGSSSTSTSAATVRSPSEVRVLVLNGSGSQGIAARGTEMLQAASYLTAAPKNADDRGPSSIYYIEGYQAEAVAVAAIFGPGLDALVQPLDVVDPPVEDLQSAAVIVVLGSDGAIPVA